MSNVAHEQRRERSRAGDVTDPWALPEAFASGAGPEDRDLAREMLRAVLTALWGLPDDERLIIDLAIAKVPHAEIAVQLGITATNVSTKLHRARAQLMLSVDPDLLHELGSRPGDYDRLGGAV